MKVTDETWEFDPLYEGGSILHRGTSVMYTCGLDDSVFQTARGKLAAAAPDMARLLLGCMWGAGGYDAAECISCGGFQETHDKDCRLVAVLIEAGAMP